MESRNFSKRSPYTLGLWTVASPAKIKFLQTDSAIRLILYVVIISIKPIEIIILSSDSFLTGIPFILKTIDTIDNLRLKCKQI